MILNGSWTLTKNAKFAQSATFLTNAKRRTGIIVRRSRQMRTLDEVIKAVEEDLECANVSYPETFYDYDNHKDALYYLKEYRETKKHLACLDAAEIRGDDTQVVNNPLLTWDELRQMEGKPVWVEHKLFKGWRLVGWQANEHLMNLVGSYSEQVPLFEDDCGVLWQAYRKEQK